MSASLEMEGSYGPIRPSSMEPVLYMECEEEPLSPAQMNHFKNKNMRLKAQMEELKKISQKVSSMSVKPVINMSEKVLNTDMLINKKSKNKCQLIMDQKTGRVIGSFDSLIETPSGFQLSGIVRYSQPAATEEATPTSNIHATKTTQIPIVPPPQPKKIKRTLQLKRARDSKVAHKKKRKKAKSTHVDLQSYFYGSIPGKTKILRNEFKADMAFKCHICHKIYFNNLEFMKHLSLHVNNDHASAVDLSDLSLCNYCTMSFETPKELKNHVDTTHLKVNMEFVCQICTKDFQLQSELLRHMVKLHIRGELAYNCRFCGARSSNHVELINHFHVEHNRSDKIQCPKCLKGFSLMGEKGFTTSVASAFVEHLEGHVGPAKSFHCRRCVLNFLQEIYVNSHVKVDHASFHNFDNFDPYVYAEGESPIRMERPMKKTPRLAARSALKVKPQMQIAFVSQNLEEMVMYNVNEEYCRECDNKMTSPGHLQAYLCCTLCRYSTCCSDAIFIHFSMFHGKNNPSYTLGTPCILKEIMYCVCSFKTNSGNKMAKHMSTYNCKSAYPSRMAARAARKVVEVAREAVIPHLDTSSETESLTPISVDTSSSSSSCKYEADRFCYICGEFIKIKGPKHYLQNHPKILAAYKTYYSMPVSNQDKFWAPHFVCQQCRVNLSDWSNGKNRPMKFAVPRLWREPSNHTDDCYFCMVKAHRGTKYSNASLNIPSSTAPVPHYVEFPMPVPPPKTGNSSANQKISEKIDTSINVDEKSSIKDEENQEPHTTDDTNGEPVVTIMNEEEEELQCLNEIPSVPPLESAR